MPRRLPTLLALAAAVGLFALASGLAQPPQPGTTPDPIKAGQEENFELYKKFSDKLLELAQRWEKSDNPEDRERAKTIRTALKIADAKGVKNLFQEMVAGLANPNQTGDKVNRLLGEDAKLVAALREILRTLQTEDEATKLKREITDLKELIKAVERIKRQLENERALTDNPKTNADRIAKNLKDLAGQTKDLASRVGSKDAKDADKGDQAMPAAARSPTRRRIRSPRRSRVRTPAT